MTDVFLSSTLKANWNLKFNLLFCEALETRGIRCYLPQRDTKQDGTEFDKFNENKQAIRSASFMISIGVNESVNWGWKMVMPTELKNLSYYSQIDQTKSIQWL